MKTKNLLLILVLVAWTASLSAQITGEQADDIVLERLSREVQSYILYAKDGVQEEMTIATSAGETLELDYPCRVYYASRTGANDNTSCYFIVNESNGNLLEINTMSDAEPEGLEEWRVMMIEVLSLINTKWKLVGIVNILSNVLKELEPKDCEECFMLMFDTDYTATVRSINMETLKLDLLNLNPDINLDDRLWWELYDKDGQYYSDGDPFRRAILSTRSYITTMEKLRLYFPSSRGQYLLFRQIMP